MKAKKTEVDCESTIIAKRSILQSSVNEIHLPTIAHKFISSQLPLCGQKDSDRSTRKACT